MRLSIHGLKTRLTARLRSDIERRIYLSLSRFGARIRHVDVRLGEGTGPEGRAERSCRVEVAVRGVPPVITEQHDARMSVAVDHAVARMARQVARTVEMIESVPSHARQRGAGRPER